MSSPPIRVLLVEDSPVALTILTRLLSSAPGITIAGTARNGQEALDLIPQVNPTIVCTDLHMPKMGGLELTQRIMAECPRPILVISASVQENDTDNVFQILQAGALDVFPKPLSGLPGEYDQTAKELINRIRILSGVAVFTQHRRTPPHSTPPTPPTPRLSASLLPTPDIRLPQVVAIGASTGGPQALYKVLKPLPPNFPAPIVVVQHISEGFLQGLVDWLDAECALKITIARPNTLPSPGTVYFAPDGCHLKLNSQGRFAVQMGSPVSGHCPSITVMFEAIAAYYRRSSIGILLTGMGRDGAEGLLAISQSGGTTIAQDERTCIVFGMPKEAIALNAAEHILSIERIGPMLKQIFERSPTSS
ncbi:MULTISPECIES: chemotaxis-specific protein-glutamate methyltransferase CheB [unclassified Leptolyngbya]|uniref:chemotaxis-specific protein-glutamate methyltransferase CheB n=1 Tax=unclassified Leptolyngbya TaxID=2650499 RepID=UPI001683C86A|nr:MULTISPECIES: chemotaxis-specific protein-glutamate methyltransferase CheB [unclassified Leptolyngbya]MBD1911464.1 chemotaxis-specific protein-glutamate methyltransferase CheB [Leptolyngbya sp. FACHB-8]MBD2153476.1 chemotaxis-specific protein-glutamate methyltransferase CheB [Leptolyngbya sp. FACHB-16]